MASNPTIGDSITGEAKSISDEPFFGGKSHLRVVGSDNLDPGTSTSEDLTSIEIRSVASEPAAKSGLVRSGVVAGGTNDRGLDLVWAYCLASLRKSIEPHFFEGYIAPLSFVSIDFSQGAIRLTAPSRFVAQQVDRTYSKSIISSIKEAVRQLAPVLRASGTTPTDSDELGSSPLFDPTDTRLRLLIDIVAKIESKLGLRPENVTTITPAQQGDQPAPSAQPKQPPVMEESTRSPLIVNRSSVRPSARGINPKYTFASFVVGSSNEFGHAAAMRVAEQPGRSYNPLFIYGGVGLGKTHLLHAIANAVLERNPAAHVLYMSSETFTNELINSLRTEKMNEFKNRLRSVEVLLIDDIQFLCGKERTQEEFFHTFNALYAARHQIVVTSDKLPQEIPGIEERLQTRFSWGLTADLQAPDFETRVAILKRKANLEGIDLPEDVSNLIAQNISSNVRELEGALTRLHAICSLRGTTITLDSAHNALKPLISPKAVNVSVDDIKKCVSNFFNIKVSEIVAKKRTRNLAYPRHIAMYLCRKHTTLSYPEIGENFGGRDHSSVIHASNVIATKVAHDPDTRQLVMELERRLLGTSFISQ